MLMNQAYGFLVLIYGLRNFIGQILGAVSLLGALDLLGAAAMSPLVAVKISFFLSWGS